MTRLVATPAGGRIESRIMGVNEAENEAKHERADENRNEGRNERKVKSEGKPKQDSSRISERRRHSRGQRLLTRAFEIELSLKT